MAIHPRQLPIPPIANDDPRAIELIRIWAAQGKQHVSIATKLWDDPASWGIMLVDLAKHIADAYSETHSYEVHETLHRLREGFDAEWNKATDLPSGEFLDPKRQHENEDRPAEERHHDGL